MKKLLSRFAVLSVMLVLTSCHSGPDLSPIGDGMKVIAICLVVSGVVSGLVELIKGDAGSKPSPPRQNRAAGRQRKEDK